MQEAIIRVRSYLSSIYGTEIGDTAWHQLQTILEGFPKDFPASPKKDYLQSETDVILITYGDQFASPDAANLENLYTFLKKYIGDAISTVHLLPIFPSSSDDGFSVIDYTKIDPKLGDWSHVEIIGNEYKLMFDFVLNHISQQSLWFQKYCDGDPIYQNYFIEMDPTTDLSKVIRPRALPLLTPVETNRGRKFLWTTFSPDQIDLNYRNPDVTLRMIKILLEYLMHGASYIRLDAIAYLWKEAGTTSIHLKETHQFVKLLRAVLDIVAPHVILITETNVPQQENISYFGEKLNETEFESAFPRSDEAQMVYQFPLAPLVLHAFLTEDTSKLTTWAANMESPYATAFFLNFIASHDGIGVRPAEGILSDAEIANLANRTIHQGGYISSKRNSDGTESIYELNITLYDFLRHSGEPLDISIDRFIATQVIMLSLRGVPGIYIHSLFGTQNCDSCVETTRRARSINREKFQWKEFEKSFQHQKGHQRRIFDRYIELLLLRKSIKAFSPFADETILRLDPRLFAVFRNLDTAQSKVLAIINVSHDYVNQNLEINDFGFDHDDILFDRIRKKVIPIRNAEVNLLLSPYQAMWVM